MPPKKVNYAQNGLKSDIQGIKEDIQEIKQVGKDNGRAIAKLYTEQAKSNQKLEDHITNSESLVNNNLPIVKENKTRLDKLQGANDFKDKLLGAGWLLTILLFAISVYLSYHR